MDEKKKTLEDWEIGVATDYFDCVKKAIILVEERHLIGWRTGELIDALADMYFQGAESERNIHRTIKNIRGDLADFDKYTIG